MKILSTISLIVLIGLTCLTSIALSEKCLEYLSPLHHETKFVDCPMVLSNDKRQAQPTSDNMFIVNFCCTASDKVLCNKVENVFITAGKYITATLNLKSTITVNATLTNICEIVHGCNGTIILGSAGPA